MSIRKSVPKSSVRLALYQASGSCACVVEHFRIFIISPLNKVVSYLLSIDTVLVT